MKRKWVVSVLAAMATTLFLVSPGHAQAPFYSGKAITILIGTSGGGSIVAARIIAQHLGKYIPGNPAVLVQPMLGAAHIVATNNVFNTAKPDGLTLLAANPNVAIAQLVKLDGVRFDVRKFEWLGSSGSDGVVLTIRADLPYKSFVLHTMMPRLVAASTATLSTPMPKRTMTRHFTRACMTSAVIRA
jgi:tripartite-type tricarboxylate transporter receptor subunit TctC